MSGAVLARPPAHNLLARGFALSHVGAVRKRNEDAVYLDPHGRFAVLADGMGGHLGGQEASTMAVALMKSQLDDLLNKPPMDFADMELFLANAVVETSAQIYAEGSRNPALAHMGATLVVWILVGSSVIVAHSGDSRGYLIRDRMVFQLTPDHTMENEHILGGKSRADVELMPMRHVLSRNVGMMPATPPDTLRLQTQPGDIWLLCSDGLSNKLNPDEILWHILEGRGNLPKSAKGIVEHAFHAGGEDNITCCLIGIDLPTARGNKQKPTSTSSGSKSVPVPPKNQKNG
jgi:protein phosphatase